MRLLLRKTVAALAVCAFGSVATVAQQPVHSSPGHATVAAKVATLKIGDKISVVFPHAAERYGSFQSSGQDDFTFHDVDENADVTFAYTDVKKVKNGYGGYNSISHKHTDHTKALIAGGVVVGLLVGLIIAAASAKD